MQSFYRCIFFCLCLSLGIGGIVNLAAQIKKKNYADAKDLDGDGIADLTGQDKCPTTLSQIQGKRATTTDEITGKEVMVRLPENIKEYLYQDRVPIIEEQLQWKNKLGTNRREHNRVETKYGKYADMKTKDRKDVMAQLDSAGALIQSKIDSLNEALKVVNPSSYIEFLGDLEDKDRNVIQRGVKVKIRIGVDVFGCLPDDDKDGSPNMVDECPEYVGSPETSGCPDQDKDGIHDKDDLCPTVKGPRATRGCPDKDKDGVPDIKDDCPDTPGLIELNGCPDRDKDGIPDKADDCPDEAGLVELKGCPDRDKDGIADKADECPDVAGILEFKGCPDRDKDGIPDKTDDCPDEPGTIEMKGCPDRDKDGVLDKEDNCPDVPGPKSNKGCPDILDRASKVLFETGKAVIKPQSYPLLDELAALLKKYTDSRITLEGHTDSEGADEDNMILSKNRAKAVGDYLIKKGIDESRITNDGFGETRPIDTNDTPAGKQKNRRVDMRLTNKKE